MVALDVWTLDGVTDGEILVQVSLQLLEGRGKQEMQKLQEWEKTHC